MQKCIDNSNAWGGIFKVGWFFFQSLAPTEMTEHSNIYSMPLAYNSLSGVGLFSIPCLC